MASRVFKNLTRPYCVVTLLFAILALSYLIVKGPFWLHQNGDVNYAYLLSGLDYWQLEPSGINDQPGILPKLWMFVVIGITYLIRSLGETETMEVDVILNSELYLTIGMIGIFILTLIVLYKFTKLTWVHFESKILWIFTWLSFFLSTIVIGNIWMIKSEAFLVLTCLLVGKELYKKYQLNIKPSSFVIVSILFIGILSKILVLPFVLLLFLHIHWDEWKKKTLPIFITTTTITIVIWYQELSVFGEWFLNTASHNGFHGSGSSSYFDDTKLFDNLLKLLKINILFLPTIVFAFLYAFVRRINIRIIGPFALSIALYLLLVLKTPSSHYFLITFSLLPAILSLVFGKITLSYPKSVVAIIFILTALRIFSFSRFFERHHTNWATYKAPTNEIQSYYTSSKSYALFFANQIQNSRHSRILHQMYPENIFYHLDNEFYDMSGHIDKQSFGDKKLTIVGSSDRVESDQSLTIIQKKVDGVKITYEVKLH